MDTLFVYGSLRQCIRHPYSKLLKASSFYLGEGKFHGLLYNVGGYPCAIDSTSKSEYVIGDVYTACNEELILQLDEYEGCCEPYGKDPEFIRVIRSIKMPGNEKLNAWIYLYNHKLKGLQPIEHGDYCKYMETNNHSRF